MSKCAAVCRVCLDNEATSPLFQGGVSQRNFVQPFIKLTAIASVQIVPNDKMPKFLCDSCIERLTDAYQLREQAQKSDAILRKKIGLIKIEYPDVLPVKVEADNSIFKPTNQTVSVPFSNTDSSIQYDSDHHNYESNDATYSSEDDIPIKIVKNLNDCLPLKKTLGGAKKKPQSKKNLLAIKKKFALKNREKQAMVEKRLKEAVQKNLEILKSEPIGNENSNSESAVVVKSEVLGAEKATDDFVGELDAATGDLVKPSILISNVISVKKQGRIGLKLAQMKEVFHCDVCTSVFNNRIYLARHMKFEHNIQGFKRPKRPNLVMCDVCGNTYHSPFSLNMHRRSHTGDKPFTCNFCGKAFAQKSNMQRHISARHLKDKCFQCHLCPKNFAYATTLREHTRIHTGERSHVCDTCGRRFLRRYALARHQLTHSGVRPYMCRHCLRDYTQANDLKAHVRRTHPEMPCEQLHDYCVKKSSNAPF